MKRTMWLVAMACLASLPLTFIGCMSDEDLYDPVKAEARLKAEYAKKFVEKYGEITPDYSWDATSMKPKYASTRAVADEEWYEVEKGTLEWLDTNLPSSENNQAKGKPFVLTVPNNKFTIVPIYQGTGGLKFTFHMVIGSGVNETDIPVWTKSQDIQVWKKVNIGTKKKPIWEEKWVDLKDHDVTEGAEKVRAKEYTFDFSNRAGEVMYFYLNIDEGNAQYATTGTKQSSLDNRMLALDDCPRPSNIDKDKEVRIIGCEDANLETDWDMNEVVFLMYGDPKIPDKIEITNNEIKESVTKRYMIEDLGSTDDFDFNDVVVDVTEERTLRITKENGVITDTESVKTEQKAIIRHLGGTLPFTLTIGNTSLPEMEGAMDVNPDAEYTIQGWEPDKNNISVTVKGAQNGEIHTVGFPENGEIPMIIAVDPTVNWMEERVSITKEWFDGLKK